MEPSGRSAAVTGGADERVRGQVLRELGFAVERAGVERLRGTAAVVPEVCVPGTALLRTSVLATWADTLTGLLAVDVVGPRVPVTLQLDVDLYAPPAGVERIVATASRLKVGKAVFVATVDFADQRERPLGRGTGLFMVSPDPAVRMPGGVNPVDALAEPGGPLRVPLAERVGCVRRSGSEAVLPRRVEGLNASGTVNGGLLALVVEEAALAALPGSTLASMALRFLRPVRVGPAVATAAVHGPLAEVTVRDEGRDGAVAVAATARPFT
ncbi:MAG TPA: hotdog domain-containing protein [Acidimicrobiales bacterium]|nr:hotdog domain-containing protein [Acidimicrobiales bacterium]